MSRLRTISPIFFLSGLLLASFLNTGTVRKQKNALQKTQTDAIKFKDKLEEIKDGEKGPATPVFGWYGGGNKFMIDPPFDSAKAKEMPERLPHDVSEVELQEKPAPPPDYEDEDWEVEPEAEPETPQAESVLKEPESLAGKADKEEDAAPPPAAKKGQDASKWEKDWWDEI